jgi:hypothetical protein
MDTPKDETTTIRAFQKDRPRIDLLKWQIKPNQKLTEPQLITALLDFYNDHQNK